MLTRPADPKGRLALSAGFAEATLLVRERDGTILIEPVAVLPEREVRLYADAGALPLLRRGLDQARTGRFAPSPDLASDAALAGEAGD